MMYKADDQEKPGPDQPRHFTLSKIRKFFPTFNKRVVAELDFWRAAKKAKIIVRRMRITVPGYYQFRRGRHYILIDDRLTGPDFLATALHEFSHFLFDVPDRLSTEALYKNNALNEDPRERFANAFAVICMLPMPELERMATEDLSDNPDLLALCRDRIKVLTDYQL